MVMEDTTRGLIVATATLFIELKILHDCGKSGHVEDVVVNSTYRGQNLGIKIMETVIALARDLGCYKVILDCTESTTIYCPSCLDVSVVLHPHTIPGFTLFHLEGLPPCSMLLTPSPPAS